VLEAELVLDPLIVTRVASFEVISVSPLSCRRLLISLAGESPWEFDYSAGQDLVLVVANDGARTDCGRYLVKRFEPRTRHLDIEAVLEPDGPAARWAASVVPGEPVAAIGPREIKWDGQFIPDSPSGKIWSLIGAGRVDGCLFARE
jgi:NADPH-dependent ferric siderophore reductase